MRSITPQPETWFFTRRLVRQAKFKLVAPSASNFLLNVGFEPLAVQLPEEWGGLNSGGLDIVTLVNVSDNGKEVSKSVYTGLVEP